MLDNLSHAKLIGDTYTKVGLRYNEDDNTFTEYTYEQKALACEVNLKCRLTSALPLSVDDIYNLMFGAWYVLSRFPGYNHPLHNLAQG